MKGEGHHPVKEVTEQAKPDVEMYSLCCISIHQECSSNTNSKLYVYILGVRLTAPSLMRLKSSKVVPHSVRAEVLKVC